jgi:hypothetical protein
MGYVPYGNQWKEILKRYTLNELFEIFGIERKGVNKENYILKIKEDLLIKAQTYRYFD